MGEAGRRGRHPGHRPAGQPMNEYTIDDPSDAVYRSLTAIAEQHGIRPSCCARVIQAASEVVTGATDPAASTRASGAQ